MRSVRIALAVCVQLVVATAYAQSPSGRPAKTTLQPIEVTAQAKALTSTGIKAAREEARLTPGGVTVVEGEILDERNISGMADMLRYVPGLYIVSDSGGSEIFFSSRGSNLDAIDYDMNGILLLKNGIPITAADGTNHNRVLNPLSAQYAIVARGANGIKYGATALGGAINFISPTAYDLPGLVARLSTGSHGKMLARVTASRVFGHGLDGLLTIESLHYDGFREHTEQNRLSVYANAGWRISPSVGTRLYAVYIDDELELGGTLSRSELKADYDQAGAAALMGNYQRNVETWRLASKTTWQIGPHQRLDIGLAYEKQQLFHPIVADFNPADSAFFDGLLINTDLETITTTFRYEHKIGAHNILFGANYLVSEDEGKNFGNNHGEPGDLQTLVHEQAETLSVYLLDRWQISEHWTLIPGVQYIRASRTLDNITVTRTSKPQPETPSGLRLPNHTEGDYSAVLPRLGVIYHIAPRLDIFASISGLYEAPTNFALKDPTTKNSNDVLEPMTGTVVEIGTRGRQRLGSASHWRWSLTAYYAWLENEILSVKDPNPANARSLFVTSNAGETIHAGIEALVSAHIAVGSRSAIEPVISLTINEFRFEDHPQWGDNDLPAAPGYVLRGEILYRNASGFYIGPTFDLVGDRYADYNNSYVVDSYALLGVLTGWSGDRWSVYLEVENLLGEHYVATHSVRANAAPDDAILRPGLPRTLYLGAKVELF